MQRIPIRNINSRKKVKPMLFDLVKEDDKEWIVEIQNKDGKETVSLSALLLQITTAVQTQKQPEP
ncbi:hypothetical protein [uncultured Ruminococcus sp.]|uniref:hypothetical protein n=1 Tax=uncultured Ruminococcus sp. TaxID=165186 RepID=UPI002673BA41|nr:hypothetical protein [uncultured Ruminococcus sp.]